MRSFSTALSIFIIAIISVVFCSAFLIFYQSAKSELESEIFKRKQSEMNAAIAHIETSIASVEASVNRSVFIAKEHLSTPETFKKTLRSMLKTNPNIYGACIAIEPYYLYKKSKYFMPYMYNKDSEIYEIDNAGNDTNNYFLQEWYTVPKRINMSYWSEPYFDKGVGNTFMVTYSQVLNDASDNFYGVVTGDIELSRFTRLIDSADFNSRATVKLISRNGELLAGGSKALPDSVEKMEFSAIIPETGWQIFMQIPQSEIDKVLFEMSKTAIFTMVTGLAVLFVFVFLVIRSTAAPIKTFADIANQIANGDFNVEVPIISHRDEFDKLTKAFVFMQESLRDYIQQLKFTLTKQQAVEKELQIARTIQMNMLPKNFEVKVNTAGKLSTEKSCSKSFDIFADLHPAKEVGGDLYDFSIKDDKLFFCIGDVSGKGVPAALFMTVACSLFRAAYRTFDDPVKITDSINNSIIGQNDSDMFVTMFVGVYDRSSEKLNYCCAGHNPPILIRNAESLSAEHRTSDELVNFLDIGKGSKSVNIPVGVISNFEYTGGCVDMSKGDVIFLYTDGVTEAQSGTGDFFGNSRMLSAVRANADLNSRDLLLNVKKRVEEFVNGAEQSDDLTKMAIRIL